MPTTEELLQRKRDLLTQKKELLIQQQSLMHESPPVSRTRALLSGALNAATFGFSDEIGAGLRAAKEANRLDGNVGQQSEMFDLAYQNALAESQYRRNELRKAYPGTMLGGEVLGGAGAGGLAFKAISPALRNVPKIPRLMGAGAAEGAAFGAGMSQPGERLQGAERGALAGAFLTPIAAGAGVATMAALRPAARRLGDALLGTPRDRAVRQILDAMDADDITPDEALILMRSMGRNSALVDLGDTLARQGRIVTSELGPAASQGKRFLDARQMMQQQQMMAAARRATATSDYEEGIIDLINGAESKAAPIYREVYSEVVDVSQPMLEMMKRPAMKSARRKADQLLQNEGFATEIAGDITDVRYLDAIKRALDDQIGQSVRAGTANRTRVLSQLKNDFVSMIDEQVPRYAEARSIFAGEAAIKEAADFGRTVFASSKIRLPDAHRVISEMGESELRAARVGFLQWMSDELAKTSQRRSTLANRFAEVPRYREMVRMLFPDQEAVENFLRTAATESRFAQTRNLVTGGSPTARIAADRDTMNLNLMETVATSASGPTGMLATALRLIKGNTKLTPDVLEEMGNILFNPNIVPRNLRPNPMMAPFNIPVISPSVTAGAAGGATGSQLTGLIGQLESMGLIGSDRP